MHHIDGYAWKHDFMESLNYSLTYKSSLELYFYKIEKADEIVYKALILFLKIFSPKSSMFLDQTFQHISQTITSPKRVR